MHTAVFFIIFAEHKNRQNTYAMKKIFYSLFTLLIMLSGIACSPKKKQESNSILKESKAPFGAPEFATFKIEDYKEAFDKGFAEKRADIKAIIENTDEPTFANTIDALEMSGKTLDKVSTIFFTLNESDNSEATTEIENYVVPKMTELNGYICMNDTLFNRIKTLYNKKESLGLSEEQSIVLENYYNTFVRGGALLEENTRRGATSCGPRPGRSTRSLRWARRRTGRCT